MPARLDLDGHQPLSTPSPSSPTPSQLAKGKYTPVLSDLATAMDDATLAHTSPSSDASSDSFPSSADTSPSSSALSLPATANQTKGKGKGKGKDVDEDSASLPLYHESNHSPSTLLLPTNNNPTTLASIHHHSPSPLQEPHSATITASTTSSVTTFSSSSAEDITTLDHNRPSKGKGSSHPRVASASTHHSYLTPPSGSAGGSGSGSGSGSASGSRSSSKPSLLRAATTPATFGSSNSSSIIPPVPAFPILSAQAKELPDHSPLSYDAIPDDFDFGDLPFYDTDPRTGIIYGDPHAVTRPYLAPEAYFDHYRMINDEADPRRTNVFNKHGTLLYYHPGRHIGQEQDSLRSHALNTPMWVIAGRTSTWGNLTATDMASKRQIRIVMEMNKKKTADPTEPLSRFVFRWKDDDFVIEYRRQKDQYRITCSQMCGGDSKWIGPQHKPLATVFHGMAMESVGSPLPVHSLGSPSPFDPTRFLQRVSEFRLNSGPILKNGDFELYNPDTFPPEFKSFLMAISIVALDTVRPVDDKAFFEAFPQAYATKKNVSPAGGLASNSLQTGSGQLQANNVVFHVPVLPPSLLSSSKNSSASSSAVTLGAVPSPTPTPKPTMPALPRRSTVAVDGSLPPATLKKSRWGGLFKK